MPVVFTWDDWWAFLSSTEDDQIVKANMDLAAMESYLPRLSSAEQFKCLKEAPGEIVKAMTPHLKPEAKKKLGIFEEEKEDFSAIDEYLNSHPAIRKLRAGGV